MFGLISGMCGPNDRGDTLADRYIRINNNVASSCFKLENTLGLTEGDIEARLVYGGSEEISAKLTAVSLVDGKATFMWPNEVRTLKDGWYELRLYVKNCCCGVYPLRVENECKSTFEGDQEFVERKGDCAPDVPQVAPGKCDDKKEPKKQFCFPKDPCGVYDPKAYDGV